MRYAPLLALLLLTCARAPRARNVILISIDTLRADYVTPARTPHLAALAKEAVVYRNAWSHCPLTLPSHLSIFTGELPPQHGVRDNAGYRFEAAKHPTLAGVLRDRGFRTAAAVSAYVMRKSTGAESGFETYDDEIGLVDGAPLGALQRSGRVTEKIAEQWIGGHRAEPFFYFLHLYEPHEPYAPTYEADVREADAIVGRFLSFLKRGGLYDDALIVVLSDHGEGLGDHGEREHGILLYREALQVPLMIRMPGGEARTIDEPIGLSEVKGQILGAVEEGRLPEVKRHALYAESLFPRIHIGWSEIHSLVQEQVHYIDAPRPEAYDLQRDPGERKNGIEAYRRGYLRAHKDLQSIGGAYATPDAVSDEEKRKLASLGYVSAGGGEETLADPKEHIAEFEQLRQAMRDQSIPELEQLLARNPRWSDVRDLLGVAWERRGDSARAAKIYQDGIVLTPRLAPEFALSAASALLDAGQYADAAKHARFAAEQGAPGAHLMLGEIELAGDHLDAAGAEEQVAEQNAAEKAHALFLAARIASARRDFPRALQLLEESERERQRIGASLPENFHYVAADTLARLGRVPEAMREFEAELRMNPRNGRAYRDLALLQTIVGDKAGAARTKERMAAMVR
ncbi:MAG TPA: sulfatase-like hydrolase/transferase [Thermoanaerobaculia bacterium]|jgi:tetratricopeptide (TPR) repeat protein|nr:sulfatase-like hydrolase/transferase [Thermoanaerobaculia bacterium]